MCKKWKIRAIPQKIRVLGIYRCNYCFGRSANGCGRLVLRYAYPLVDIPDGIMVLIPKPENYSEAMAGLHKEIWQGVDSQKISMRSAMHGPAQRKAKINLSSWAGHRNLHQPLRKTPEILSINPEAVRWY
jgi:hypothetical protein